MSITLVGVSTGTNTATPVAHLAGDLIIIAAFRATTGTPSLPSGYTSVLTKTGTTCSLRVGYRYAVTTNDAGGTWTNATATVCHVYRPSSGNQLGIGSSASAAETTNTINYPAITLADNFSGNSFVLGFVGNSTITNTIAVAPSGMTNQSHETATAVQCAGHDTNGGVTTWSSTSATTTGTAGDSVSVTVELMLLPITAQPPHIVQHIGGGSYGPSIGSPQTGNAFKRTVMNPIGAGNCLIMGFMAPNGKTVTSVVDSVNGSWTSVGHANAGTGNLDAYVYMFPNSASGQITLTITFASAVSGFQYTFTELSGIDASPSAGSSVATFVVGPVIPAGSFTPTNNNATGGNFIWNYFVEADSTPAGVTANIRGDQNFTLLNADIGWINADGVFHGSQAFVQTTSAAINPTVRMVGDTDHFNSIAVALKLNASSGTPAGSGIRLVRTMHHTTDHFAASGNYVLQSPCVGNLRVLTCDDPALNTQTVTDSEGNTWSSAGSGFGIWYMANTQSNSNLQVTTTGGGGDTRLSFRFFDVIGAATSPFDSGGSVASGQTVSSVASFTSSPAPTPTSSAGITIGAIGLGQGPGLTVTAPAAAVFALMTYTGETDFDYIEDADLAAHFYYTSSGAQTWTWSITSVASNSTSGGFASFKSAPLATPRYRRLDLRLRR